MSIPAINFKDMGVLSITRTCLNKGNQTQIIYKLLGFPESSVYLKCTDEEHDALALEFKQYLAKAKSLL